MQTSEALRAWSWQLFSRTGDYGDPLVRSTVLAQKEILHHSKINESTYKVFIQAILFAGAEDHNLEFSLSQCQLCEMTGLARNTISKLFMAASTMGHIRYTGRTTSGINRHRRTRIYRIVAMDSPDYLTLKQLALL